jgi:hypothetical protein
MNKMVLALSVVSVGVLVQPFPPDIANAVSLRSRPARLEDMNYVPARRIILSHGWAPAPGPCEEGMVEDSECRSFPEIDTCSGVSPGYCHMVFARRNLCLDITTTGGPPVAGQEQGDTEVSDVSFRRGRCWRVAFDALRRHDRSASRRRAGHTR